MLLTATTWASPVIGRLRPVWAYLLVALVGAIGFAGLCDAVGDHDGVTAADGPVATWFASHRTVTEGQLGLLLAQATSPSVLIGLVAVAAVVLHRRGRRLEATVLAAATASAYLAGAVAKLGEHRARPVAPINLAPEIEAAFPSGHVLVVTTIALVAVGLAWSRLRRAGRVVAVTVASVAVVAISLDRLVVGAHWLTDVVGALALAAVVAALALAGHRLLRRPTPTR